MEILRQPDSLSLLGNLKEFLISSSENVTFALSTEIDGVPTTLITESYIPDAAGRISIDVTEICRQYLKTELPGDNVVAQENAARTFTATIGATSVSFRVVNASVRNLALTPTDYLEYNFLTLQPQTKKVSWHSPEYLSYYFVGTADIKAKFYLVSGDTETVTVASITPELEPGENGNGGTIRLVNKVYTVNTTLSRLMALSSHSTDELQGIVDVWVEQFGDRKSYIQRYVYAPATGEEHHYLAVNSLGGIDTFTFHGEQKISGEIEHQVAENSDLKISVTQDGQRKYRQTTGYLGAQDAEWLWEFLHSNQQWVVADGTAEAIALQSSSLSQGDITALNSSSFDFVLAREGGLLPESRRDETFPDITVPSPVSDLFFLTPRLIDFPVASGDSEIVFPVQTPYSNTWKYLTLSALGEKISISIIPNHTHGNLAVLNELGEVDGHLTYRGSAIGSGNGITLPIAISDVDGLRTILKSKADSNHTHHWTDISDRPLRLSDFTNDLISSWALAATKPDYSWSEILNKPTTLTGFGITDGYSSLSTTGSGNAITGVSGSGHALTFTKGNTFVDLASEQTISGKKHISYLDVTGALAIPQVEPTSESGKVFEYIDNSGSFGEVASAVTPADLKDLVLKINGVTKTTYNPASAASFNVDLTSYATQSWVEAKNYLQGITKAMVEAVLTGNITSHTHSQYLTSHQSLNGYATESWVQQQGYLTSHQSLANYYTKTQADAKFLTEHQSLENYALKSEIPTSMAWTDITGRPTKLSQFTNDLISSWALAATKPDYSWSEILNKPTTLTGFGITDGYSSLSTTGSGNAITGVSGSGHALTFTKGNTFVDLASEQTISGKKHISYLDVTGALAIPQVEPTSESGKVFEYIDNSGSFGEVASAVTPADLKDLTLKINGVVKTTYNPSSAASFNVDLTSYATQSWVEAKNYLQGITKAMVEAVLTGNITSHTHSQYLTEHQSLADYALKSEIPTSMAWTDITGRPTKLSDLNNDLISSWAMAASKPSYTWSEIGSRPTKLSQFTNDIVSSWAMAATKPSYSWSEITSRPSALSAFSEDSTHRLVTDSQISAWNRSYGELIMGTQTAATGSWTGVSSLATASDMTSGYRFTYWLPYAGSGNATLTLTFGDGTTKTFNLYLKGSSRLTTHFPAGSKIDFVYLESVSVAGSSTKYTGAWPEAYYDTTYSAGTKALFDAGASTSNRVWSASVLASAVAAKEHSHLWADIADCPSKLSDFTNDLISSWALAATKPSYSWSEITSRPTTLASFSGDSTHRLVTDTQISNWNSAYGWGNHADAGYLTSFTESDPTVPAWAKTTTKPSYTLDEVTDGSTRKLSNYVPTTRTINSKALSGNITLTLDDIANGTNRSLANYLPLSGGTLTGYVTFNTSSDKSIYANNGTLNQRVMLMSNSGNLSIGYDLPGNSKYLYLDGYQTYLRFGSSKNYSMTLWSDGTIRSSTGTNLLSIGYRSGNTIYPFKNVYSTINVSTKCAGTMGGTMLYGVARFAIQNTKKARTFAIKIPSSMGAYVTFKIVLYSPFNLSPSSTITVSAGAFNLTATAYCALYPSCAIEGSFAGRVAFARDGNTSSANMYILLGSCNDTDALYQGGMIAIDSIIHADSITNADTIMNFGYELLDLDNESMFTKITECVNADAHFKSVTVEDHVTAPKIDCTSMMLVPTIEPSSVPVGKVAEYIDLTGSFAN